MEKSSSSNLASRSTNLPSSSTNPRSSSNLESSLTNLPSRSNLPSISKNLRSSSANQPRLKVFVSCPGGHFLEVFTRPHAPSPIIDFLGIPLQAFLKLSFRAPFLVILFKHFRIFRRFPPFLCLYEACSQVQNTTSKIGTVCNILLPCTHFKNLHLERDQEFKL